MRTPSRDVTPSAERIAELGGSLPDAQNWSLTHRGGRFFEVHAPHPNGKENWRLAVFDMTCDLETAERVFVALVLGSAAHREHDRCCRCCSSLQVLMRMIANADVKNRERSEKIESWLMKYFDRESDDTYYLGHDVGNQAFEAVEQLLELAYPNWRNFLQILEGLGQMRRGEGVRWGKRPDGTWGPVEDR